MSGGHTAPALNFGDISLMAPTAGLDVKIALCIGNRPTVVSSGPVQFGIQYSHTHRAVPDP